MSASKRCTERPSLQWLQATVWRNGMCYTQRFERGRAVTGLEAREEEEGPAGRRDGNVEEPKSGTCVQFMPDPTSKGAKELLRGACNSTLIDLRAGCLLSSGQWAVNVTKYPSMAHSKLLSAHRFRTVSHGSLPEEVGVSREWRGRGRRGGDRVGGEGGC